MGLLLSSFLRCFRARRNLKLENLALLQQFVVLKRKHPRPRLVLFENLFWILAHRFWAGWKQAPIVVSPDTGVGWHRAGFALYWRVISKSNHALGRKRISKEVRDLIFRMVRENPT
jgi:putative transposase